MGRGGSVRKAHLRPPAEVKGLLLIEEPIPEAPELRAIGLDQEKEPLRIAQAPSLLPRLGGIDLDIGQNGRFPSKPGRSESPKKSHNLWLLLLLLAGFRRTVYGDSRPRNAVKPAAYWTYPDAARASIGAQKRTDRFDPNT